MSVKIHHGPPGSYKTSGAVADDVLDALLSGRVVVTNIRGLSDERAREALARRRRWRWAGVRHGGFVYEKLNADWGGIIHQESETAEGRERWARWWHWVPLGALVIVDEAQSIWPKAWRQSDIDALAYPGGADSALSDGRPWTMLEAWERHRHYNWDIVITMQSLSQLRADIRAVAEGAYKHRNLGTIGIGARYVEGYHSAEDSGASRSHFLEVRIKKIPSVVWRLYDSTATGQHSDTIAGRSIFRNPRLLLGVGVIAVAGWASVSMLSNSFLVDRTGGGGDVASVTPDTSSCRVAESAGRGSAGAAVDPHHIEMGNIPDVGRLSGGPLDGAIVEMVGYARFAAARQATVFDFYEFTVNGVSRPGAQLRALGYQWQFLGDCVIRVWHQNMPNKSALVLCGRRPDLNERLYQDSSVREQIAKAD